MNAETLVLIVPTWKLFRYCTLFSGSIALTCYYDQNSLEYKRNAVRSPKETEPFGLPLGFYFAARTDQNIFF